MKVNEFLTVKGETEKLNIIERSKFICYINGISDEDDAKSFIEKIKKMHSLATHNCYAYIADELGLIQKFSDDGEPQGTAGMPVLNVILQEEVTDCVVVVTRYFGGILLGGGGLVRAYTHSAKIGIDAAEIITLSKWTVCEIQCEYTFYGKLETFIRDFGGVIENSDFGENVTLNFRIKKGLEESFDKKLQDLSNGRVSFSQIGEVIAGE